MGGGSGGNNGIATIPAGSRKVVQSLKEIVDCPEQEIYAALRDCNMDPNEAVNRLLSQDPFHEVKSKREKKKENKDTTDSRARSNTSNRGGRTGTDRYTRRSRASASTTTESAGSHGKPAYKKENGSHAYGSTSVAPGDSESHRSIPVSDPVIVESKTPIAGESNAFPGSSSQTSSGFQPAWFGMPGQVSMADIVKMGRPQGKASGSSNPINSSNQQRVPPSLPPTHSNFHSLPDHQSSSSRNALANNDWPLDELQVPANDGWPQFEHTQAPVSSVLEPHDIPLDGGGYHLDERQHFSDEGPLETNTALSVGSSVSSKNVQDDESQAAVLHNVHAYEHDEDEEISASMQQQLSLKKEEEEDVSAEDDGPAVVIPDHLQVHVADCQHLSFGSFGSIGATFGGPTSSRLFQNDPTEAPLTSDNASISLADISNQEHYGDEHLRPASSDMDNVHGTGTNITNYETAAVSETEVSQKDSPKHVPENQYAFASSGLGYDYDSSQGLGAAFSQTQTSVQMQNLSSYSNILPSAYSSSLPTALLQPSGHTGKEFDLAYLPFNVSQSMPTKFSNPSSSISSASAETFRATDISTPQQQQASQNLPPASLATGPALPQHLPMHPYSQPTLPLGHFANMVSYPFLPQNYSYMPSAFQQAFAGNSTYHQSLAAASVLPQYKNNLSVSSLPQSGAGVPAGYGFGSSSNIPGVNFPLNQAAAPVGTNIGYDDALSSHYKDAAQLLSLQQNENSAMWMHGLGSRTMQPIPTTNYYNYNQVQSQQQPGSLRQGPTPSQHYGALGYPNFYQSAGISLEQQQQQMVRGDVSLNGSQGQQQKQSPQLWQNNY